MIRVKPAAVRAADHAITSGFGFGWASRPRGPVSRTTALANENLPVPGAGVVNIRHRRLPCGLRLCPFGRGHRGPGFLLGANEREKSLMPLLLFCIEPVRAGDRAGWRPR